MAVSTYYMPVRKKRTGETFARAWFDPSVIIQPGAVIEQGKGGLPPGGVRGSTFWNYLRGEAGIGTLTRQGAPSEYVAFTGDDTDLLYNGLHGYCFRRITVTRFVPDSEVQPFFTSANIAEINNPVNPLLLTPGTGLALLDLLQKWAAVRSAFGNLQAAIHATLNIAPQYHSFVESVTRYLVNRPHSTTYIVNESSVLDAVVPVRYDRPTLANSVFDSASAYAAGLIPGITNGWAVDVGALPSGVASTAPFAPLMTLWRAGYLPCFDGRVWTLRTGPAANIVLTYTPATG